jgi:ER membrane protein complex subunit 1
MRWYGVVATAVTLLLSPVGAIFADEAYHVDFHHALLGSPHSHTTFFQKPHASTNASLLYTVSDKAVLGAINPRDGSLLWRQALAGTPIDNTSASYLVAGADGQLVTGHGRTIACWDASDGRLIWDYTTPEDSTVGGLLAIPTQEAGIAGVTQDFLVLAVSTDVAAHTTVARIAGDGSAERWQHVDRSSGLGTAASIAASDEHIFYVTKASGLLTSSKATIVTLDRTTGKDVTSTSAPLELEVLISSGNLVSATCTSWPFLISHDKSFKAFKFSLLDNPKISTATLDGKGEEIQDITVVYPCGTTTSHFLIHIKGQTREWAEVYHVNTKTAEIKKAYSLQATEEASVFAAGSIDANVFFTRSTETEVSLYSSESHGQLGRWQKPHTKKYLGNSRAHATAEIVSRGKASYAVRVAEFSSSGHWSLIRNGELQWTRPELLAYATIAAWDVNGVQGATEELGKEVLSNPLTAYIHRVTRHLQDLSHLPAYVQQLSKTMLTTSPEGEAFSRQSLVGSKAAVLGTSRNEIIAIAATVPGNVLWQADVSKHARPGVNMTSIAFDGGRVSTYLSDGSLVALSGKDGSLIEYKAGTTPLSQLVQLPGSPAPAVIKVGADGVPRPATDFAPNTASEGNVIVTISNDGKAFGWTIGQSVEKTWTLSPAPGTKIISAASPAEHDPVASIGRVLGDRNVLYKYLNPNIALLIAASTSGTLTTYLVDAVTGAVLHISTHTGVTSLTSIPAIVSENWFAYTFTSFDRVTGALSTQLIISELYESAIPNDRGMLNNLPSNYSSFSADAAAVRPHVISRSFTLAEPISKLSVSQTAQGITSRQILAFLPNSNAIVGLPREILDPRRPTDRDANATEREEGLVRYSPELPLDPKMFLTHAREVMGIEHIMSTPSLLESTSMVFAFGHDVFGTAVTPSMAFDVLGKGFNKAQLVLTVVALGLGTLALRPLVRSRSVEGRWKI